MRIPEKPKDMRKLLKKHEGEIFKLLRRKDIMDIVAKYNKEYIHWDEFRYKKLPSKIQPEFVWALMKIFRREGHKFFKFGKNMFRYSLLDDILKNVHVLDKGCAGRLESDFEFVNREGKERYIISSLMEEAIASSQLEGAATTRKIAKEILRLNRKPRNYSEQMIVNGYRKIQKIVRTKQKNITPEMILELQRDITYETLEHKRDEGRFRDNNDVIVGDAIQRGKVYHIPPDYNEIPELVKEFCDFANKDNGEFMHPIIKGIILHFLIGYMHPFNDGNGRTARSIFYWYVLTRGYWLFEYMSISRILLRSKRDYALSYLYTETDDNDLTYFIKYNLSAIEEALRDMELYIKRKQKEQTETLQLIKGLKNINVRQADMLKEFTKDPEKIFFISEIMNTYGVVYQTARSDLLHLTKMGYINKILIKKKFGFKLARSSKK